MFHFHFIFSPVVPLPKHVTTSSQKFNFRLLTGQPGFWFFEPMWFILDPWSLKDNGKNNYFFHICEAFSNALDHVWQTNRCPRQSDWHTYWHKSLGWLMQRLCACYVLQWASCTTMCVFAWATPWLLRWDLLFVVTRKRNGLRSIFCILLNSSDPIFDFHEANTRQFLKEIKLKAQKKYLDQLLVTSLFKNRVRCQNNVSWGFFSFVGSFVCFSRRRYYCWMFFLCFSSFIFPVHLGLRALQNSNYQGCTLSVEVAKPRYYEMCVIPSLCLLFVIHHWLFWLIVRAEITSLKGVPVVECKFVCTAWKQAMIKWSTSSGLTFGQGQKFLPASTPLRPFFGPL